MNNEDSSHETTLLIVTILIALAVGGATAATTTGFLWPSSSSSLVPSLFSKRRLNAASHNKGKQDQNDIPWAPGAVPILGHALSYKRNAVEFLHTAAAASEGGGMVRINLAGQRLLVVTDRRLAQFMARQSDDVLSLRHAVQEYGFDWTLGVDNVLHGTEFHKQVIRSQLGSSSSSSSSSSGNTSTTSFAVWMETVQRAMARAIAVELESLQSANPTSVRDPSSSKEAENLVIVSDLFTTIRRIMTRVVLQSMVGACFVAQEEDSIIDDVIVLLDKIEDATAAAAVLPHWVARPLVLYPTQRLRLQLQEKIVAILAKHNSKEDGSKENAAAHGLWLRAMKDLPVTQQAEFVIGLLFAAAKNPSLGAAQALCFVLDHREDDEDVKQRYEERLSRITAETKAWDKALLQHKTQQQSFSSSSASLSWDTLQSTCPYTLACIKEATRLTALAIGSIRKVMKPIQIPSANDGKTYTIARGETVAMSLILPNTNAQEWSDRPHDFDPTRFLDKTRKTPPLLTFSQGTHHCPGERLAVVLMHALVTHLWKRQIKLRGTLPPLSWERATVAQRQGPVTISVQL